MSKINLGSTKEFTEEEYVIDDLDYVLRQAPSKQVTRWRNHSFQSSRIVVTDDKRTIQAGDIAGLEPLLVSYCLFLSQESNGQRVLKPVALQTIENWPNPIVAKLFERAKEISRIDEEEETQEVLEKRLKETQLKLGKLMSKESEAKNLQSNMTDNSE